MGAVALVRAAVLLVILCVLEAEPAPLPLIAFRAPGFAAAMEGASSGGPCCDEAYRDAGGLSGDEVPESEDESLELQPDHIACWEHAQPRWRTEATLSTSRPSPPRDGEQKPALFPTRASPQLPTSEPAAASKHRASDYNTVFTNAKAGMDDVDKEYVKSVVYTMSKDSNFFKNEQRKNNENTKNIEALKLRLNALTAAQLESAQKWADKHMVALERTRDLSRTFIHVDMDMFFAAVEQMHRPELKDIPFAIGGLGMISTANYVARKYGVRSAMPGFIGKVLCAKPAPGSSLPSAELEFVQPDFSKYTAVSQQVKQLLKDTFDPHIQSGGIDEVYLDVTDYMRTHKKTADEVAQEVRVLVQQSSYTMPAVTEPVSGLTCSCGAAPNRRLAKICSDINKPNGQYVLGASREEVLDFVRTLPIRKVGGIGKVTERTLEEVFGARTCHDLALASAPIACLLQPSTAQFLLTVALGSGGSESHEQLEMAGHERKSISCERTFRDLSARKELENKLQELATALAQDMMEQGLTGKTLTLKLKPVTFDTFTRAVTLASYTCDARTIMNAALALLRKEYPLKIRLMGLRMSKLATNATTPVPASQPTLSLFFGHDASASVDARDDIGAHLSRHSATLQSNPAERTQGLEVAEEAVDLLLSLARCPREEAVHVLRQCGCDVQRAADLLFHRVEAGAPALPAGAAACTNSSHQRTALSGSSSVPPELASASQARVEAGHASQVDSAGAGRACASDAPACSRPGTGTITSFFAPRGQAHTSASKTARCPPEEAASSGHDRAAAGGASQADLDMQDKIAKIVEIGIANRDQAAAALSKAGGRLETAVNVLMEASTCPPFLPGGARLPASLARRSAGTSGTKRKAKGPLDAVFMRKPSHD